MKQNDRASPYFGFTEQSVRASPYSGFATQSVKASPWARVTGQTVRDLRCGQWSVSSDLERSSKDQAKQLIASRPWDFQWSTTRTEQGISLLTISILAEGSSFWTSQIATPLDKSLFEELTLQHVSGLRPQRCATLTMQHPSLATL